MIQVTVTQDHVERGLIQSAQHCAIALALHEMGYEDALVEDGCIWVGSTDYAIPKEAQLFIDTFDAEEEVQTPLTFTLDQTVDDYRAENGP